MELLQTLRRIRACEGDAAAQLLLEAYVMQEAALEREACAKVCDELFEGQFGAVHVASTRCAAAIRARSNAEITGG
jgi:anthranilate phosphoribosyltransferase